MLDHVSLRVSDLSSSKRFFARALAPLGYGIVKEFGTAAAGLGVAGKADLWIIQGDVGAPIHLAFASPTRAAVDEFHAASLAGGARDNGAPGVRAQYHPSYYAAFVIDPDGNNIEAVCRAEA